MTVVSVFPVTHLASEAPQADRHARGWAKSECSPRSQSRIADYSGDKDCVALYLDPIDLHRLYVTQRHNSTS